MKYNGSLSIHESGGLESFIKLRFNFVQIIEEFIFCKAIKSL